MGRTSKLALLGVAGVAAAAVRWRRNPSACPYNQRFWVEAPHPFITRDRLREALAPRAGERLLEVGPGTGYYSLPVADWLGSSGTLEIFDIQQEFLDHTMGRATEAGLSNLVPTQGDAQTLPYADDRFDGAFLVTVLGEIPDPLAGLRELARVVRPGGRIVVGELIGDPHMVTTGTLRRHADAAGLFFEERFGPPFGFFARLRVPEAGATASSSA
jgi:ubiquinone/menaquinone biosynthesis C-methylase UbiE